MILKWNFAFIQNFRKLFNSNFVYINLHFRTCHFYTVAGKTIMVYTYQIESFTTFLIGLYSMSNWLLWCTLYTM